MSIGGVVVTYNSRDTIEACLASLSGEPVGELIVVDNDSTDGSWELVPSDALVRNEDNVGFGRAVNQAVGLFQDNHEFILLINPDAMLIGDALSKMADALMADPRAGAAGPKNLNEDGSTFPSARRFPNAAVWAITELRLSRLLPKRLRERVFQGFHMRSKGEPTPVDWLVGSCVLLRKPMWDAVKGFDEEFFLFGEEQDLFWRASKLGWHCLYVPEAEVVHLGGHSFKTVGTSEEYEARRWESTRTVARRHMSRVHYLVWIPIQRLVERKFLKALRRAER